MILLARHGETDYNLPPARVQGRRDVPLNDHGRAQARELAHAAAGEGLRTIWSSHLSRARETAGIVAEELGLEVRVDERLAESDRGEWEGRLLDEIARDEPELWDAWRRAGAEFLCAYWDFRFCRSLWVNAKTELAEEMKRALFILCLPVDSS